MLNAKILLTYPANFYNGLLASFAWGFFSLYSIILLTDQTNQAFGWKREEMLLLNGTYGIFITVFHVLFSRNFERFASVIHLGQLDTILLKPMDSQFLLSTWHFGWTSLIRVLMPVLYVIYLISVFRIHIDIYIFFVYLILGFTGVILLYALWYVVITCTIWFTRISNLVELMFNITGIARYPQDMYTQSLGNLIWFLFPLVIIVNIPTRVLLQTIELEEIMILCILTFFGIYASRFYWKFALKFYTSASS